LRAEASQTPVTEEEKQLLLKVQRDSINYFITYSDRSSGLTKDSSAAGSPASIAATGFSLAALAIGQDHGWITYRDAYNQILRTLQTLKHKVQNEKGFFFHFVDMRTGRRTWRSEASSIDTALLLAGALLAAQYYKGSPIETLANEIYDRVDWHWMLNNSDLICMGWKPETGFLPYYWDSYSEHLILQALAIGARNKPISNELWNSWTRYEDEYAGHPVIYSYTGSLFTYQYAHAFIDFRKLDDAGVDYFENSVEATKANRQFTLDQAAEFKSYGENSWGLSASLGPFGYKAYGALPGLAEHDGTIAPHASTASLPFTPRESLDAIKFMYEKYGSKIYGRYGFKDAYNVDRNWWAQEYLGIDQGIMILMIENFLNGTVWKKFMRVEPIKKWVQRCSLESIPEIKPKN